jgi:two-component system, OmpR family, phosphate regulon sensor histidine kinase PhoR
VRFLGFTPKLRLAPLWPALAALLAASALLWVLLPGLLEKSAAVQLEDTLDLLGPVVLARIESGGADLQGWVRGLAGGEAAGAAADGAATADNAAGTEDVEARGLRLTLIAADGTVLADSARTALGVRQMENHATRPEVQAALGSGHGWSVRKSATIGRTYVYAARTLTASGGRLFVLRLAQPLAQLETLKGSLAAALLLAVLAAGLAGLVLSLWLDRRLFRPLAELIAGASALGRGRYDHRVAVPDADELADLAVALNRLGTTVEEQLAALRHERDRLQAILAGMSEGVLVVDGGGRAILANPAFCQLFGLSGEVAGRPVLELVRAPELDRLVEATLRRGEPQEAQIEIGSPERHTLQLASTVLADLGGAGGGRGGAGAVVVARDTTELTRLMEMRRDFVANVSHELKTPLAAIRGYAETLRDGALGEPATASRFTERILRQCRRLQALLDDLLTLSRLESLERLDGASPHEPVDLDSLVRRAVDLMSSAAEEKQIRLALAEPGSPLVALPGDAEGLERLVVNLLDNAIKYNQPGGEVVVRLAQADGEALLEVSDTGIGIPQEALPRIFERFYRVDKGRSREEGGTGLGLAIVKHVAQAHGGQIEVESRLGKGSTFRVHLPLGRAEG